MTKMIEGGCPHCDAKISVPLADECPAYERLICSTCKQDYWLAHSVIAPMAYSLEAFEDQFEIDDVAKTITPRLSKLEEKELEKNQYAQQ